METMNAIEIGADTLRIEGEPSKLYENLAKAQAEFEPVPKVDDGQVGKDRKFKYAGYATLMKCVRPALSKYGIALLQPLHWRDGKAITTTIIAGHGASIQSSFAFNADYLKDDKFGGGKKDDCQEFGRAHTYYRRYQLQSILGVEGDDDADGLPIPLARRDQFAEPPRDASTGEAVPKKAASAPKAEKAASAEPKPVAAVQPTLPSVQASDSTTSSKATEPTSVSKTTSNGSNGKSIPADLDADKLKDLITSCMKQLGWKMIKLREFFGEHVDANGFETADSMPLEQMRTLHQKLVEKHNCAPF